jgi:thiol-disulfide isomerase/thioredoxin
MSVAAAQFGLLGTAKPSEGKSRELAALTRATAWLNSPALSATTLLGKVVLVQFGTYTCINWLRTLPYVREWVQKYRQGLIVVGVQTPEFGFEKKLENVRRAVQEMKIDYPIAIDNDYSIWRSFNNHYWPALYFIDARGRLRQHHFGEGEYARSETAIQRLLAQAGASSVGAGVVSVTGSGVEAEADWGNLGSPEIYVARRRRIGERPRLCGPDAVGTQSLGPWRRMDDDKSAGDPERGAWPNRVPFSRARRSFGDGTTAAGERGTLPRRHGWAATGPSARFRC